MNVGLVIQINLDTSVEDKWGDGLCVCVCVYLCVCVCGGGEMNENKGTRINTIYHQAIIWHPIISWIYFICYVVNV